MRIEDEVGDLAAQHRGRSRWSAYPDAHSQHRLRVFNDFQGEIRDIHKDIAFAKHLRQPAPSLHVQFKLTQARRDRNVQLRQCRWPEGSVRLQSVPFANHASSIAFGLTLPASTWEMYMSEASVSKSSKSRHRCTLIPGVSACSRRSSANMVSIFARW